MFAEEALKKNRLRIEDWKEKVKKITEDQDIRIQSLEKERELQENALKNLKTEMETLQRELSDTHLSLEHTQEVVLTLSFPFLLLFFSDMMPLVLLNSCGRVSMLTFAFFFSAFVLAW